MLVKSLIDTGSSRYSFFTLDMVTRLGLANAVRPWHVQHKVGGNFMVPSTSCVDLTFRLGEVDVLVTLGIMELPVSILLGMYFMRRWVRSWIWLEALCSFQSWA